MRNTYRIYYENGKQMPVYAYDMIDLMKYLLRHQDYFINITKIEKIA